MPRRLHHGPGRSRTKRRPSLFTPGFMPTAGFAYPGYGILRFTIALAFVLIAGTVGAAHPLKPPDTSSPRTTFETTR